MTSEQCALHVDKKPIWMAHHVVFPFCTWCYQNLTYKCVMLPKVEGIISTAALVTTPCILVAAFKILAYMFFFAFINVFTFIDAI